MYTPCLVRGKQHLLFSKCYLLNDRVIPGLGGLEPINACLIMNNLVSSSTCWLARDKDSSGVYLISNPLIV